MTNPRPVSRISQMSLTPAFLLAAILVCALLAAAPAARAQAMPLAAVPDTPLELVTAQHAR